MWKYLIVLVYPGYANDEAGLGGRSARDDGSNEISLTFVSGYIGSGQPFTEDAVKTIFDYLWQQLNWLTAPVTKLEIRRHRHAWDEDMQRVLAGGMMLLIIADSTCQNACTVGKYFLLRTRGINTAIQGFARVTAYTRKFFLLKIEGSVWLRRKVVNLEGRKTDGMRQS
ncbi:hypothetical protein ARMGADRAFT_1022476 [Armillaria gallica]|uniref:Uncharacterized protein n=1 Tax=Armillaria gallica TaxID=47427 RepID=A0A2H3EMX2_ARMGA|nr:hypothetical protein ARMGADRAFT_1022476 [Armillaria gallica]